MEELKKNYQLKNGPFLLKFLNKGYRIENKKTWTPCKKRIELKLTNYCNLKCDSCDACMDVAQTGEYLSLDNVRKFVEESIALRYEWERLKILGGELTLHPFYPDVINILDEYRKFNNDCEFVLSTNGVGTEVEDMIEKTPPWITHINSVEQTFDKKFERFELCRMAPIDLSNVRDYKGFSKGCWIVQDCGLSIFVDGLYYPCSPSHVVNRMFELEVGEYSLRDILTCNIRDKLEKLCRYCGHFLEPSLKFGAMSIQSKSWDEALQKYLKGKENEKTY